MAAQDVSQDRRPAAVDRSGDRGGSIGHGAGRRAAAGRLGDRLPVHRPRQRAALYSRAAVGARGDRRVRAVRRRRRHPAARRPRRRAIRSSKRWPTTRAGRHRRHRSERAAWSTPTPPISTLVDAVDADDVRPVERVFIGDPEVSEAIYRLAKAAREGRRVAGRGAGRRAPTARRRAGCASACGRCSETAPYARWTVWTVADVTRDRERQENVFQELQHAIDYLDHAPAGFFSVDPRRRRQSTSTPRSPAGSTTISRRSARAA